MWDTNPSLIEEPFPGTRAEGRIPVVLMHDGGGTIYSYYCLGRLDRPMYGMSNPHFAAGSKPWEGGIPEMARHYVSLLRAAIPEGGPVILGGWSLGGLLSLEMARVLMADGDDEEGGYDWRRRRARLRVVGIVMVDSVCPMTWKLADQSTASSTAGEEAGGNNTEKSATSQPQPIKIVSPKILFGKNTKQETKDAVMRCFAHAGKAVSEWKMPDWDPPAPPPMILLRARDSVPVEDEEGGGITRVDIDRRDTRLGWDAYRPDLFCRVVEVPGHHYNIFSEENIQHATDAIKSACDVLERMAEG